MTEKAQGAPLLRPLITKQGLLAAIEASTLGKAVKIVQVGLTATPGIASDTDTTLPGAQILDSVDGRVVNDHQVNVSVLLPDTFPSLDIAGIGFYLEDGTLFALYREEAPFLEHTAGTTLLVGMDLVMDNIPSESVIVESTGANLILGDWVPVERQVNGKALTKDIELSADDVGALDTEKGGTVNGPIFLGDNQKYISTSGGTIYVASLGGKLILEGKDGLMARVGNTDHEIIHTGNLPKTDLSGYVPKTRKVNNKALDADITLTPEDIKAAKAVHGHDDYALKARTVNGQPLSKDVTLTHTDVKAVPLTRKVNGKALDADITLNADNVGALDTEKGGTMKGAIIAAIMKASIWLKDKASIVFQDGGGVMWHQFASGGALLIGTGLEGGKNQLTMTEAYTEFMHSLYSRTGLITRNSTSSRWLAMEAPESGNPYISAQASGESNPVQVIGFEKDRIRARKMLHADSMQVQADAGLRFAPTDDWSGVTWGLGIHPETRFLALHKYVDGAWHGQVLSMGTDNALRVNGLVVSGGSESEYHQIRNAGNPSLELHEPGQWAAMMYKPHGGSALRFCQSNGAGGEAYGFGGVDLDGFYTVAGRFRASYQSANRPWGGVRQNAFHLNEVDVGEGSFVGTVGACAHFPGHWGLEFNYGVYTSADPALCGHILNCHAVDGSYHRKWQLRNDGFLEPAGGGWHISPNGDLFSSRLSGMNVVDWTISSFSQIGHGHDAAQGNLSMVQGRHSEVGTYMHATLNPFAGYGGTMNPGSVVAGSALHPSGSSPFSENRGWALPGTWMCVGAINAGNTDNDWDDYSTLWFRVA